MSDNSTNRMIEMYMEDAPAPLFLSGLFQSPPRNFHTSEKVEIDIIRDNEEVAIVVQDLTTGARNNENSLYVNKSFTPPIYDEEGSIHSYDTIKRIAGANPYEDPNFGENALNESFRLFRKLEKKIRRGVELMASQVLQDGILTLKDSAGVTLYTLDFKMKASHKITTSTTWATSGATGDPLGDIRALADVVRDDGKLDPNQLIFGTSAIQRFLANPKVLEQLNNRRMNIGEVRPVARGGGATYHGLLWLDHYEYELWSYNGTYTDPNGGAVTRFLDPDNVIVRAKEGRLDLSFGAIPLIGPQDAAALPFLPPRMSDGDRGLDLTTSSWFTPDRKHLRVSAGTRPLTISTAIDTYARLNVTV